MVILGSLDSALPPKSDRRVSLRKPPRQLSLGQDSLPASPLISTRNLVPGLSYSVVKLDRLGKGATSNVFRAVHTASLKMVALKEVMVSSDADRKAVRTEMRALRSQRRPLLNSAFTTELKSCPRIVDFYGSVVRENGNACIAVEYVAGGSLSSWLDSGCKCPEAWIAHIAHQALEALDFLHTGGRVHRDVKPANILITRKGDIKLGDFGAAGVENSSRMIGTQRFMAPERLKGHRATAQSDLWSLGLSLATAAVGNDFISQANNEFEQLDLAGGARTMLAKATTISPKLRDFLHRCLSRDPARRPALRELMKHPFLNQRFDWAKKCPEVAVAMRENRRRRRESPTTLTTKAVLDALCEARAEDKLIGTPLDPVTADDLAYELGVTAESLVRSVHRGTLELIRERGGRGGLRRIGGSIRGLGGLAGDPQRSRPRQCSLLSTLRENGGWGVSGGDTSVSTLHGDDSANFLPDSEESFSSISSPPPFTAAYVQGESLKLAPFATVGNVASSSSGGRNNQRSADAVGNSTPDRGSSGTRKRLEMSATVKLTPHKRRGEKRSSQTKRHGSGLKDIHRSTSAQPPDSTTADSRAVMRTRKGALTVDTSSISAPTEIAGLSRSGGGLCTACSPTRASGEPGCDSSSQSPETERIASLFETRKRPVRAVFQIADEMKVQIQVRDRVYRLKVYPDCFSGREAVQWMLDGCHASSVDEAEKLGNEMMKASVFQHILNSQLFEDSSVYYQFTDGVTPPPPAKGGRRLRQVARVWGGHVARKFVQHSGANSGSSATRERRVLERTYAAHANSTTATKRSPAVRERISCGGGGIGSAERAGDSELLAPATTSSFHVPVELGVNSLPKLPKSSSMDRKKHRRSRRHSTGKCKGQLRRFSSSVSTVTMPETPH